MGFFDSVKGVLGMNDDPALGHADLNLGKIFLPGGLSGGATNEQTPGGFGGSPLNEQDWRWMNENWSKVRGADKFGAGASGNYSWMNDQSQLAGLSPEAQKYAADNWGDIRRAGNFGDIDWTQSGKIGSPNYAPAAGGAPGGGAGGDSTLGDLEPARGMFANIAAGAAPGGNTQGNILDLLRQQAQPYENKAFQGINNNLFMRGRLGGDDSATGEAYRGFSRGIAEADTGRQLASYGLADQLQTSQLGRQLGAAQGAAGLTELSTLPFDMALKLAMARSGAQLGIANSAGNGQSLLGAWNQFFGGAGG